MINLSKSERKVIEEVFKVIIETHKMEQLVSDDWTVKDLMSHILWYEEEMVTLFKTKSMNDSSSIWNNPTHERNELVREEMSNYGNEDILTMFEELPEKLWNVFETLNDEDMVNPDTIEGMPKDWKPWEIIAGNTFRHYKDHSSRLKEIFKDLF